MQRSSNRSVRRLGAIAFAIVLSACTFTVDSVNDAVDANPGDLRCRTAAGECTLRAAIMEANATFFGVRIEVPAGVYNLTLPTAQGGGTLQITRNVSLRGAGAGSTIIDAGGGCTTPFGGIQVLRVSAGSVDVRYLTIRGGDAQNGGGIWISGGNVEISDVEITDNFATTGAGGLWVSGTAQATVRRATIHGNCAAGAFGGGIRNTAQLFVYDSLVANNYSNRAGGIRNTGTLNLRNTTISGNYATSTQAGTGGISQEGFAVLNNVTITQNTGRDDPQTYRSGGIQTGASSLTVLKNSIIADNDGGGGPNDCVGPLTPDSRHNLIGDSEACEFTGPTTTFLLDVAPGLFSLGFNGGPTQTHALQPGSPAREAGYPFSPPAVHACERTDQRGVLRPQGDGVCDMGAFEFTAHNIFVTGFILVDATNNVDIQAIRHGELLSLSNLPSALSIRVTVSGQTGSVVFDFNNQQAFQIENVAPYALGGDNPVGNYHAVPLPAGAYSLTATPFANPNGAGAAGGSLSVNFQVVGSN